jgi:formate dehydrogenase major subunit
MSSTHKPVSLDLDRRSFMKASALAGTVALGASGAGHALDGGSDDAGGATSDPTEMSKTICNYCSVGCGFRGEREGDAFVGMESWDEHPINAGSLCSKGAAILETEHSERRLKRPMIQEDGEWRTLSWNRAYERLGNDIKALWPDHERASATDIPQEDVNLSRESIMILGSAHHSNEESYAIRKLAAFMGTNNVDHQARICHSTTVAGLANTWGYGAMTQPINDYRNFDLNIIIGQNPAEAHPVAMQHILEGQRRGGTIVNVDPRYTKTSAHADYFYRLRPGTDVALMMGLMKYLRDEGELAMGGDDETGMNMLDERVMGWPDVEAELDQYDLDTVADITWIDREDIEQLGDLIIENRPHVQIEWAMGSTQHNNGTQNIRSYAITSLASGSSARSGGGLQVMRGHANVQGATDLAVASHILPGYYGLTPGGWQWWADVWDNSPYVSGNTSFEEMYNKFEVMPPEKYVRQLPGDGTAASDLPSDVSETDASSPAENSMMFQNGLTVARWFEGALDQQDRMQETPVYQPEQVKIAVFWGHSANSISEMRKMKGGMENLDLLVVIDLFPGVASVLPDFDEGPPVMLLPAASQYEHYRSLTNSHRATQWSEPVAPPAHQSRPDLRIMQELADELGFGEHFDWGSGTEMHNGKSSYEDVIREFNLGTNTIGYRQTPERIQQHLDNEEYFDQDTLRAPKDIDKDFAGDYWMLPWPCWGEGHPGTPIIWNDDKDPRDGGQDFRTRWGPTAPSPDEWSGGDYPLSETVEQQGEEGLSLIRDTYEPDWLREVNAQLPGTDQISEVIGIPEYPGWKTTLPESILDPDQQGQSDELTVPQQYALDPTVSIADAAEAMDPITDTDIWEPTSKGQIYDQFTTRSEGYDSHRVFDSHIADQGVDADTYAEYDNAQPDAPTGRGRARAVVWSFLDTVPVHREPIESPRPDLVEEWPANGQQRNFYRLDQNNRVEQQQAMQRIADTADDSATGPLDTILTTGRQVEHQGGGSETRNNIYTADIQPHMYCEITPNMAQDLGVEGGDLVVVSTTDRGSVLVKARVTNRPSDREVFMPYHWGGVFQGESLEDKYPDGHAPIAIGDSVNSITSRGYDVETQMQETKAAMVSVQKATPQVIEALNMESNPTYGELNMQTDLDLPQDREGVGVQKDFDVRKNTTTQ